MKRTTLKNENKGAAMLMVLCVLCIFLTLGLSMIFMSFQVLSNAQQVTTKEQAKITAVTFNKSLQKEITDDSGTASFETGKPPANIREYVYDQIENKGWKYYNSEESGHEKTETFRTLHVNIAPTNYTKNTGTVETTMYWESEKDSDFNDANLVTIVKGTFRNQSYSVKTQYEVQKKSEKNWIWTVTWQGK